MLTDEFKREDRYIIIKLKDLKYVSAENHLRRILREGNIPTRAGIVVESDWPEHEVVWSMIETRMAGRQWHEQFDAWNTNPYTIALQESIVKDYVPKVASAIEAEVRAEAQEPCQTTPSFGCIMRERDALQAKVAEQSAEIERLIKELAFANKTAERESHKTLVAQRVERRNDAYCYLRNDLAKLMDESGHAATVTKERIWGNSVALFRSTTIPEGMALVPLDPDIGSNSINDAGWKFLESMPDGAHINGHAFNNLKSAFHAALLCWIATAQGERK